MTDLFTPTAAAVYDPIIKVDQKATYPIIKGGAEVVERVFTTNAASNSSTQFSVPPPNPGTFVSRRFKLKQKVLCRLGLEIYGYPGPEITAENGIPIFSAGQLAWRQYPLASLMKTLNIALNGSQVSLPVNDVIKPLLMYHNNNRNLEAREMSTSPGMRDNAQDYDNLITSINNPLSTYGDGSHREGFGRGAFPMYPITNAANSSFDSNTKGWNYSGVSAPVAGVSTGYVSFESTFVEELFLSPLVFGGGMDQGFIGLQSIDINIQWDVVQAKILSCNPLLELKINNITYQFKISSVELDLYTDKPTMLFRYVTPPRGMSIPRSLQYYYTDISRYETQIGTAPPFGKSTNQTSNNIQLNSIPRFLYIYVRKNNTSFGTSGQNLYNALTSPDAYACITSVRINWNNKNTLLSNASTEQLYDISRKNGCDLSWTEWSCQPSFNSWVDTASIPNEANNNDQNNENIVYGLGSILCIEFGTDIGLENDEAPGLIGTYNLQVTIDYSLYSRSYTQPGYDTETDTQIEPQAFQAAVLPKLSMYLVTCTPGIFTIYDNAASQRIGVLSPGQISGASAKGGLEYTDTKEHLMSGGFKFRKALKLAKRGFRKAKKGIKKAPKYFKKAAPYVKKFGTEGIKRAFNTANTVASDAALLAAGMRMGRGRGIGVGGRRYRRKPGPKKGAGRKRKSMGGRRRKPGRPKKK